MFSGKSRNWHSTLSQLLKEHASTSTVEEAVRKIVDNKFRILINPTPPIDLSLVASICGIMPSIDKVQMHQDGRLVFEDGKLFIQVNASHSTGRQRFSAAHEISHKIFADVMGKIVTPKECSGIGQYIERMEEEWLCDLGAKHLTLLTPRHINPFLREVGFSREAIQQLEETFQISFEAAVRSLVEASSDPTAVLYLTMGFRKSEEATTHQLALLPDHVDQPQPKLRIARYYKSKSFPVFIPKNKSVPQDTCIGKAYEKSRYERDQEPLTLDGKNHLMFDIEAIPRTIYIGTDCRDGVVALLSNPREVV
jgi:Zn-dependent peptidase ImmA (M78 family)